MLQIGQHPSLDQCEEILTPLSHPSLFRSQVSYLHLREFCGSESVSNSFTVDSKLSSHYEFVASRQLQMASYL